MDRPFQSRASCHQAVLCLYRTHRTHLCLPLLSGITAGRRPQTRKPLLAASPCPVRHLTSHDRSVDPVATCLPQLQFPLHILFNLTNMQQSTGLTSRAISLCRPDLTFHLLAMNRRRYIASPCTLFPVGVGSPEIPECCLIWRRLTWNGESPISMARLFRVQRMGLDWLPPGVPRHPFAVIRTARYRRNPQQDPRQPPPEDLLVLSSWNDRLRR